jgi:DNA invertase Pin-like site-specific DNA recombinase
MEHGLEIGSLPPHLQICHVCDNPPCVRPDHLWLGTQKDNVQDALQKRRLDITSMHFAGELHHAAKLTEVAVQEIRTRYASGDVTQRELAREFGVDRRHVSKIVHFKKWAHVS